MMDTLTIILVSIAIVGFIFSLYKEYHDQKLNRELKFTDSKLKIYREYQQSVDFFMAKFSNYDFEEIVQSMISSNYSDHRGYVETFSKTMDDFFEKFISNIKLTNSVYEELRIVQKKMKLYCSDELYEEIDIFNQFAKNRIKSHDEFLNIVENGNDDSEIFLDKLDKAKGDEDLESKIYSDFFDYIGELSSKYLGGDVVEKLHKKNLEIILLMRKDII